MTVQEHTVQIAISEVPAYVRAGDEHVFGVLTAPAEGSPRSGLAVVFLHAGARNLSAHRNALWARLGREVAQLGALGFRMDYHGTGDSTGVLADRGVGGQTALDIDSVVAWLGEHGANRVMFVTTCWGGLVALTSAARLRQVVAACLVAPPLLALGSPETAAARARNKGVSDVPVRRVLTGFAEPRVLRLLIKEPQYRSWVLRRARRRLSAERGRRLPQRLRPGTAPARSDPTSEAETRQAGPLAELLRRRVDVQVLYGERDVSYRKLCAPENAAFLAEARRVVDIVMAPLPLHRLTTLAAQQSVHDHVIAQVRRHSTLDAPSDTSVPG